LGNAGAFLDALTRMSFETGVLLFGSSANLSLTGTKFRVEDVEPEILAIVDLVIDCGLRKYHPYRSSSTLLNLETLEVVRYGSCFEDIADAIKRHVGVELPPRPHRAAE
jgi:tRNA A37 threonylcarbamoyladenosine synthetase subunit TsaC/SUA5/YrdC